MSALVVAQLVTITLGLASLASCEWARRRWVRAEQHCDATSRSAARHSESDT